MTAPSKTSRRVSDSSTSTWSIARGLVERYLKAQGGASWGFTFDYEEEQLAIRIFREIERAVKKRKASRATDAKELP